MFELKKFVAYLLEPLSLTLLSLAMAALLYRRRPRLAVTAVACGGIFVLVLSLPHVAWLLARGLEHNYTPLDPGNRVYADVRTIVVLSGGYRRRPGLAAWDEMDSATLRRTLEGVRLAKGLPNTTLILSGGDPGQREPPAPAMAAFARAAGIDSARIRIESHSRDTADQAAFLAPELGHRQFILVTSACHLDRATGLFAHQGAIPIAAPTEFLSDARAPRSIAPSLYALNIADQALHEYLGLFWYRLRDQI